jgi:hypothetical protein
LEETGMNDEKEKLTSQQEKAIVNLLSCKSTDEAAAASGISRTTLWRWRQQPEFKARLKAEKQQVVEAASLTLQAASSEAADVLVAITRDLKSPGMNRFRAAKLILEFTMKLREQEELIQRLDSLEEQFDEDEKRRQHDRGLY